MVAKKKSRKPRKKSGDPITVGGGGNRRIHGRLVTNPVALDFDAGSFPNTGGIGNVQTFAHALANMKSLVVYINGTPINLTPIVSDPLVGPCQVIIKAKGNAEQITIDSNKLSVTFDIGKYPPKAGNNAKHESQDLTNFIKSVSVNSPLGSFEKKKLTAADVVLVKADIL